jgi:uncharacterized repeat protein (TIGR01451 family)
MRSRHAVWPGVAALVGGALLACGCREHMPHAFTWPAGGDQVPSHAKPPEGGYYTNWDPYAVELEVVPVKDVNPVRTQHVLVATVRDKNGKPLPNRRVEWMVADGSVGDIVEVDESGWRASRGYKVDNHYAVSHTNNFKHVLDMGDDDPSNDLALTEGQTWCVITSPIEGETNMVVYAPGIYDWAKHKVFVTKQWYDINWQWPPPATNPVGTTHEFVTMVTKHSDGSPLENYEVTYQILDGPAATFEGGGTTIAVRSDSTGAARARIHQTAPAEGTNNVQVDIVRGADVQCCKPAVHIATGQTSKTWIGPKIGIAKTAPAEAMAGQEFQYTITVNNPGQVDATNVVVTDNIPDGIAYTSSSPSSTSGGPALSWSLGTLAAGQSTTITVNVHGTRTGTFENCAEVRADFNLSDRACATTRITAAALTLEKTCPAEVTTCDDINYVLIVRNTGDGPAQNVVVEDTLANGLTTTEGRNSVVFNVGTLNAGEARQGAFVVRAQQPGSYTNRATAKADGGLSASAECTTVVRKPSLAVTKTGPATMYIGRPLTYQITVTNNGDTAVPNVGLTDQLPAGVAFVSATEGGSGSGGTVSWNLGTLAPGAAKSVSVTVRADAAGSLRDVATVRGTCAEAVAEATTEVKGVPALLLEVVDQDDPDEVGSTETYTITVTNQGSAVGTGIRVIATVQPEADYVSSDGPTGSATADGKTITFGPLGSLAPKAQATFKVVVKSNSAGDTRFRVTMMSEQLTGPPVEETESTNFY